MASSGNISSTSAPSIERAAAELARFEELLDQFEHRAAAALSFERLRELGRLYRLHTARLAHLRQRRDDPAAIRHLNALCVRAYSFLYVGARARREPGRRWWLRLGDVLGQTWRAQVLAWLLLLAGMLVGAILVWRDPAAVHSFVPAAMGYSQGSLDHLIHSPAARASFLERHRLPAAHKAAFGSFLFVNNTRVGLLSFATGMLAAIPTVLLQLYNGLMLGAFASIFLRDPWPLAFLAWILPHGIPELTAITMCAAGGLMLGGAVAAPGRRTRRDALRAAVPPALALFLAAVPLFVVAAAIESFVRESMLSSATRLGLAALALAALIGLSAATRRLARRAAPPDPWLRDLLREQSASVIVPARSGSPDIG